MLADNKFDKTWNPQAEQWQDVGKLSEKGSCYKVWYDERELEGKNYSFVVVHSSALEEQKEQNFKNRFSKQKESLEKKYKKIANQSFACIPDA